MQVMLMRLMSKGEYLIVPKGTKFKGSGKLGLKLRLKIDPSSELCVQCVVHVSTAICLFFMLGRQL